MNTSVRTKIRLVALLVISVMAAVPISAGAAIQVSSNGTDSGICGVGAEAPCATIAQAVANAAEGETILVGPGVYAGAVVDKTLALYSSSGTGAASIVGAISLTADGIRFGKRGKGFAVSDVTLTVAANAVTVRGNVLSNLSGVCVEIGSGTGAIVRDNRFQGCTVGTNVVAGVGMEIRGNRFAVGGVAVQLGLASSAAVVRENDVAGNVGLGMTLLGSGHFFWRNLLRGVPVGFTSVECTDCEFRDNVVVSANGPAFQLSGSGLVLTGNAALDNGGPGIMLTTLDPDVAFELTGNVAIGNGVFGILVSGGSGHVLVGNSAIQNEGEGVILSSVGPGVTVEGGNLYGNGTTLASNCGLLSNTASTVLTKDIYWGASSGPGADPADIVCGNTAAVLIGSPADAAAKIKIPSIK